MLFVELNDGTKQNLGHISEIKVDGSDVVYYGVKGSLDGYREHFDSEEDAQQRFEDLQKDLLG